MKPPIALGITGASGSAYGLRLLECLLAADHQVWLMISQAGRQVLHLEQGLVLPPRAEAARDVLAERFQARPGQLAVFGRKDWMAPVASGSNPPQALVICPCTTGTLGSIAAGTSNELIERAADVVLKEGRKLILVVRETPFSSIHLENMLRLARLGAVIMPANPGFYHQPQRVEELIDYMVARVLDHLGVAHTLLPRWGAGQDG